MPTADELYQQGRNYWNLRTEEGYKEALLCYDRALVENPNFKLAYAGKADVYSFMAFHGLVNTDKGYRDAQKEVDKIPTTGVDDRVLAGKFTSQGWIDLYYKWDISTAQESFDDALDIYPNYALAHLWHKDSLLIEGRWTEAIQKAEACYNIANLVGCPEVPAKVGLKFLLVTCIIAQNDAKTSQYYNQAEDDYPCDPFRHDMMSRAHVQGVPYDYDQALAKFTEAAGGWVNETFKKDVWGIIYAFSGDRINASRIREELEKIDNFPQSRIALIHRGLGDYDDALACLLRAEKKKDPQLLYLKNFPEWQHKPGESFRDDLDWDALINRLPINSNIPGS
ncbi:hypothetical protein ACFL47_04185 [Candidatus Latescibacterota bacterium]